MLVRPDDHDARVIGYHLAGLVVWLGAAMLLPAAVAVALGDVNVAAAFGFGAGLAILLGRVGARRWRTPLPLNWSRGMITAGLAWPLGSLLAAVPLYLSGHYRSVGDAAFEALSGLTTTGLTLVEDLDHLPVAVNLWRHGLQVIGGLGIVIVALSLFTSASSQAGILYGAGRHHDRTVPNPVTSLRQTLRYVVAYAGLGTVALAMAAVATGLSAPRAAYHALLLTLSATNTGGFAPTSASVAYYHAPAVEVVLMVLMIAGALSLAIHAAAWRGDRGQLLRHLGVRTFAASAALLGVLALVGMAQSGAYTDAETLFRKGVFLVVSAHTTTGLSVVPGRLLATDLGLVAPAAMVGAMAIGGTFASTAGGIKAVRLGQIAKAIVRDVRRVLLPDAALVVSSYHAERRHVLTDAQIRAADSIVLLFLLGFLATATVALFTGEVFTEAVFEAVSATANAGLSTGVLHPEVSGGVKSALAAAMWVGRMEFLAVFAVFGYIAAQVGGRV